MVKKNLKRFGAIALVLTMLLSLCACDMSIGLSELSGKTWRYRGEGSYPRAYVDMEIYSNGDATCDIGYVNSEYIQFNGDCIALFGLVFFDLKGENGYLDENFNWVTTYHTFSGLYIADLDDNGNLMLTRIIGDAFDNNSDTVVFDD